MNSVDKIFIKELSFIRGNLEFKVDAIVHNSDKVLRLLATPTFFRPINIHHWREMFNHIPYNSIVVMDVETTLLNMIDDDYKNEYFSCFSENPTRGFMEKHISILENNYPNIPIIYYEFTYGYVLLNILNPDMANILFRKEIDGKYHKNTNLENIKESERIIFIENKHIIEKHFCNKSKWFNFKYKIRKFFRYGR